MDFKWEWRTNSETKKLRALLARKKAEEFAKSNTLIDKNDIFAIERLVEKNKVLEKFIEEYCKPKKKDIYGDD